MLEFVAKGQWLALVPVPAVSEYLTIGLMISASWRDPIGYPQWRKVHGRPNGVPGIAIVPALPGFGGAHGVDLVPPKTLKAVARPLFPPLGSRSSSSLA